MSELQQAPARPTFAVGARVRVKTGIPDPDYPGMPLDGWAGSVVQVADGTPTPYLVRWSPETLASIHPAYRECCQRHDFAFDRMWLLEEDLEPDPGGPPAIQRPTKVLGRTVAGGPRGSA